ILYAGNSDRDIEAAFANLSQKPGAALLITVDAFFYNRRALIVTLAARHALPTVYFAREFAEIGGLISYGRTLTTNTSSSASIRVAYSKARNRPTFPSRSRQNSTLLSTWSPPARLASTCRPRWSRSPTR